jgi:Transcriptional regulator, AbiEi antitoxin
MVSVLDRLGEREAQARVLVERLRKEAERAAGALAAADGSLSRLVITRETVAEVLDSDADESTEGEASAGVRGVGRDAALYERITRIFAEAGGALRPRQVCEALGMSTEARFIEAMRPKLTRLVADGVLVQVGPGLFAPVGAAG